ncbi:MAG: PAC2 family protein [Chloroflexi bacterium]|nr:PAC2 family protein [Chloroflexota bacterium]
MSDLVHYEEHLPDLSGLRDPLLIAGFGGSWGTSAAAALRELVEHWEAEPLASIDPQPFFDFTVRRPHVRIVGDAEPGTRAVDWPANEFFLARPEGATRDLVLFVGSEPQLRWRDFIEAVIAAMERFGLSESLMLGAYRAATPHSRPLPVQLYSRDAQLGAQFGLVPQPWSYEGPAGITTPLAVACEERGWSSSSLLAAAPFYVSVEPHPFAARALIQALGEGLGAEVDIASYDEQIEELYEEAEDARGQSDQFARFVETLEQNYDDMHPAFDSIDTSEAPEAPELVEDVESFLRQLRNPEDSGQPGSEAASGSP